MGGGRRTVSEEVKRGVMEERGALDRTNAERRRKTRGASRECTTYKGPKLSGYWRARAAKSGL